MNFEEQRKAYEEDPVFHQIVDVLFHFLLLLQGQFTVGELRDAVTFAHTKFKSERVRPILLKGKAKSRKTEIHFGQPGSKPVFDKVAPFKAKSSKGSTIKEIMAELGAEAVYNNPTRAKKKEEKKGIK